MRPTERKRMVDTVVGLSLIDELARWAGEEALSLFRQAEAIERTLVVPVKPDPPEDYRPACELEAEIADLRQKQERLSALEGWLSHVKEEPVAPEPPTATPAAELKLFADKQTEARARRRLLEAEFASFPAPSRFGDAELDQLENAIAAHELWQERVAWLKRIRSPGTRLRSSSVRQRTG